MQFFCLYGSNNKFVEVFANVAKKSDYKLLETWRVFDSSNPLTSAHPSERTCFLPWDVAIRNLGLFAGEIVKITSTITGSERLEGLVHVEINKNNEVQIEALETAPWNREIYLGDKREFRQMGLILIANAIFYGAKNKFCGTIRLESLEVRESYYRNGLEMLEVLNGEFCFSRFQCREFLAHLKREGFVRA